jgi:beta-lactamase regulating signal transducer with metallopeptidase domain
MGTILNIHLLNHISSHFSSILTLVLVNSTILFLLMYITVSSFHRASHSHRHLMWFLVVCGIFVLALSSEFFPYVKTHALEVPVHEEVSFLSVDSRLTLASRTAQPMIPVEIGPNSAYRFSSISVPRLSWSSMFLIVWLIGAVLILIRIILGKLGLLTMLKHSKDCADERSVLLLERLAGRVGVHRKIALRTSNRCLTPFTCTMGRPLILLPTEAAAWPEVRLRVVLLHELAHIRRNDHITRNIVRCACTLFWFTPVVWILHRYILREEENACDEMVVPRDIPPAIYARHLVDIVRASRGTVLQTGNNHAFSNGSMLEQRVRNILSLKRNHPSSRCTILIRFLTAFLVSLILLLTMRPVTATTNSGSPRGEAPYELLYGRWINEEYDRAWYECIGTPIHAKLVFDPDGTWHEYRTLDTPEYSYVGSNGTFIVAEYWMDIMGNHWYKVFVRYPLCYAKLYYLCRIDRSGDTLDMSRNDADYPSRIDRDASSYGIYHRQ